jgi:hypothetical protein
MECTRQSQNVDSQFIVDIGTCRTSYGEEVREKYVYTCAFPSLDELIEVFCQALTGLTKDNGWLCSMMFFPHFWIGTSIGTAHCDGVVIDQLPVEIAL